MALQNQLDSITKAARTMRALTAAAHGTEWSVAYEVFPDGTVPVGVQSEDSTLVMGDSVSQEGVAEADAEFVAVMDPLMAQIVTGLLEDAALLMRSGMLPAYVWKRALDIAALVNKKYPEGKT